MEFFRWKHIFHDDLKQIVEERKMKSYLFFHTFDIIALFFYTIRAVLCLIANYYNFQILSFNFKDDLINIFLHHLNPKMKEFFLYYVTIMLTFTLCGSCKFYFNQVNTLSFLLPYDLTITNRMQINACFWPKFIQQNILTTKYNNNLKKISFNAIGKYLPGLLKRWYCWQKARLQMLFSIERINKRKLTLYTLKTVPNISIRCRLLIFKFNMIIDYFMFQFFVILGKYEKNNHF